MSPVNQLRALIAGQLVWIAFAGIAARSEQWAAESGVYWFISAAVVGYLPMQYGSPILAWRFAGRANLPGWKFSVVVAVEAALAFALLIAMMPLFQ